MPDALTLSIPADFLEALQELISRTVRKELEGHDTPESGFLDVDGAAEFLASTPTAIRSLVKRDAIPYHKAPNGRLLFDRDELDAWVRAG